MISLAILSLALPVVRALSSYVPVSAACPASPLIRPADGLSDSEEAYRVARKAVADKSLKAWLLKTNPDFGTDELPTVPMFTLREYSAGN
jgi:lysophospholipase